MFACALFEGKLLFSIPNQDLMTWTCKTLVHVFSKNKCTITITQFQTQVVFHGEYVYQGPN